MQRGTSAPKNATFSMKVLFTGASSFTGYWFVRELADAGHDVVAVFRQHRDGYMDPVRRARVERLLPLCRPIWGVTFGEPAFLELIGSESHWDLLCHHAADVRDYRSSDFDVVAAFTSNVRNAPEILDRLKLQGCRGVVLTGSFFEQGEGAGSDGIPAVSPYGLSKFLTAESFRLYLRERTLPMGKFVVPNPFGPFEERRFTAYLMEKWFAHEIATVRTPDYVRDNIHVSLLAKAYRRFVERLAEPGEAYLKLNPSGYVETQGAFAHRVAREVGVRTGLSCRLELEQQREFPEPMVRINTDRLEFSELEWNEQLAWDEMTSYYQARRR
jgi:nucleoside-diphosphate-sugar epimerase